MNSDRFNSNVDLKVKTEATPIRRIEVITGVERRRQWSDEEKRAIIAESSRDDVVISNVARRYGLRPQQLFNWRNEFRKREASVMCGGTPAFATVMIADDRPSATPTEAPVSDAPLIEIVLGGVTVRTRGSVDAKALAAVLRAVKVVA
jgi:transposase